MNNSLVIRALVILGVLVWAAFSAYPPQESINLGLDLRGGMHLVLEVETNDALRAETDQDMDTMRGQLAEEGITGVVLERSAPAADGSVFAFTLSGVPAGEDDTVDQIHTDYLGDDWDMSRSGDTYRFSLTESAKRDLRSRTVDQARRTIERRVDAYGVAEPAIQRQGFGDSERLVVQLPGVDDPERVKDLIQDTAFLEFRLLDERTPNGAGTREQLLSQFGGTLPADVEIFPSVLGPEESGEQFYAVQASSVLTGRDLRNASVGAGEFNEPVVNFRLSYEKGTQFGEMTSSNIGRRMAIILDGQVLSAPSINGRINDRGMIEGGFDQAEALDLSLALKSGALPAGITTLEERTVGPSLGQDSIDQGLEAGLYGAGLVVVLMLVVYLLSGMNAIFVLAMNVVLVFGALASLGATLTLPGIAGIILTIGMAVDANVLIFERIREELRIKPVKAAVKAGFEKAFSSILDANVTTLIAAIFLFQFGTGPIRGFAVTLSVGIFASVFTAVFVSRFLFDLWLSRSTAVESISI